MLSLPVSYFLEKFAYADVDLAYEDAGLSSLVKVTCLPLFGDLSLDSLL